MALDALTPNPGGSLTADQVYGRDRLISGYWETLAQQSLLLLAPRRIGKSSICTRMVANPPAGFEARMRSLEGLPRASDLVERLYDDVRALLPAKHRTFKNLVAVLRAVGNTVQSDQVTITVPPEDWRAHLDAILADLDAWGAEHGPVVVLIWDEFPLFIDGLVRAGHDREAMQLLDALRAARQRHHHIRTVFTGSVGLHEIIAHLKRRGYGNEPINDVAGLVVPVLEPEAALGLARALVRGLPRAGDVEQDELLANTLVRLSEGHPYVLQHLAWRLRVRGERSADAAEEELDALIDAPNDPLDLGHWLDRLAHHFDPGTEKLAWRLLDQLATAPAGLTAAELIQRLRMEDGATDTDRVRELLRALRRDQYLVRRDDKYRFLFAFLRQWWARERCD